MPLLCSGVIGGDEQAEVRAVEYQDLPEHGRGGPGLGLRPCRRRALSVLAVCFSDRVDTRERPLIHLKCGQCDYRSIFSVRCRDPPAPDGAPSTEVEVW